MANSQRLKVVEANAPVLHAPRKLDIACGQNKTPGFKGIDLAGSADIIHDLFKFPWPIKTSSVQEATCNHFVEHIPHRIPGVNKDGFFAFFEEVQRVLKKGGTISVVHPYSRSDRAFWDPTHERYIHEQAWYYLNKEWRTLNGLDHYNTDCDFDVVVINGSGLDPDFERKNQQQQQYMQRHYFNVVADLQVMLKVRK